MEGLSKQVDEFSAEVDLLLESRTAIWQRRAQALEDATRLAAYSANLGPTGRPAGLEAPAHLAELPESSQQSFAAVRIEAEQVTALVDEIAQRTARIAQLRQDVERARKLRNIVAALILVVVVIVTFLVALKSF